MRLRVSQLGYLYLPAITGKMVLTCWLLLLFYFWPIASVGVLTFDIIFILTTVITSPVTVNRFCSLIIEMLNIIPDSLCADTTYVKVDNMDR